MSLFFGNVPQYTRARDLQDEFAKFGRCRVDLKVYIYIYIRYNYQSIDQLKNIYIIHIYIYRVTMLLWIMTTKETQRMQKRI